MPKVAKKPAERQQGQVVKRGEDKYLLRVFLGRDAAGKRQYSSKTFEGKETAAQRELARMLDKLDTGTFVAPSKLTLCEYLTGHKTRERAMADWQEGKPAKGWLGTKRSIAAKTLHTYREVVVRYILPTLANVRVDHVTHDRVQQLYNHLTDERGLRRRSVEYAHQVLSQAMRHAVRTRVVVANPCEFTELPKEELSEPTTLSAEQVALLLETASNTGDTLLGFWHVLLMGGLRPGEALALQWDDLEGDRISIKRAVSRLPKGGYVVVPPKTKKSRRAVTLPASTLRVLQHHRAKQAAYIMRLGPKYERNNLIFGGRNGGYLEINWIRRHWKALLKLAALPDIRLYDARHTHATVALEAGENLKVVSERLGHSTITLTADTYSHVSPEIDGKMAARLDTLVFRKASNA